MSRNIPSADLASRYLAANQRLIILDYDGVIVPEVSHPGLTIPTAEMLSWIRQLSRDSKNKVVIVSNRDTEHLDKYWSDSGAILVAENGALYKHSGETWTSVFKHSSEWIEKIAPALNALPVQFEGTFIDRKSTSISWHYGAAKNKLSDADLAQISAAIRALPQRREFALHIGQQQMDLTTRGIDVGSFIARWIGNKHFDFVLAIGEAQTDHNLFGLFANGAFTVRVYPTLMSNARYNVKDRFGALLLLKDIAALSTRTTVGPSETTTD